MSGRFGGSIGSWVSGSTGFGGLGVASGCVVGGETVVVAVLVLGVVGAVLEGVHAAASAQRDITSEMTRIGTSET
ncbi:MAG: hypothetical protein E2O95_02975 [Acidobacteria bacterium]|nr:MAG: hypothetical protein E2O95_02975 [Acidobacteriota bacterium]